MEGRRTREAEPASLVFRGHAIEVSLPTFTFRTLPTMSEAQSNPDVRQLLHDDDCNITDEYDNVVEGALDMRRKFSLIVTQARRLRNELLAKQAEIDRLNARRQQELSHHQRSVRDLRKRVQAQGVRLQQNRETMRLLRRRYAQSTKDIEAEGEKLEQVDFLRCGT